MSERELNPNSAQSKKSKDRPSSETVQKNKEDAAKKASEDRTKFRQGMPLGFGKLGSRIIIGSTQFKDGLKPNFIVRRISPDKE